MGKKAKVGKARKDKFYHLAKEAGYRSRAAFKLLQLNRKFEFLQSSSVVLDLCAAPGGWLQVARECAPVSGLIIGVDLVPIRPVPNVKTLVADITTAECRALLRKELQHFKIDCVLHDGAPNVGKDWGHDEFQQANLCHQALLLAAEFLRRGGCFVTKIFRSADYEKVKFVLMQLFRTVKAAKPEASRLESAEIYLVCQGFRAPDKLDPAFYDITKVFGDVATPEMSRANLLDRVFGSGRKRKAQGYTEADGRVVDLPVSEFLVADDPLQRLAACGRVVFDLPEVERHELTTEEVKACCKDVKVLGKGEVSNLLLWRRRLLQRLEQSEQRLQQHQEDAASTDQVGEATPANDVSVQELEDVDMEKIDNLVAKVAGEERRSLKKKLKRAREVKKKLVRRIQLSMFHKGDVIEQSDDIDLFSLGRLRRLANDTDVEVPDLSDTEEQQEQPSAKKVRFDLRDPGANVEESAAVVEPRQRPTKAVRSSFVGDDSEDPQISAEEDNDNVDDDSEDEEGPHPLLTDLEDEEAQKRRRTDSWFSQPAFADAQTLFAKRWSDDEDSDVPDAPQESESSDSEEEEQPKTEETTTTKKKEKKTKKEAKKELRLTTPEELAIATRVGTSRKERRNVVESGFHRFMFNDENLPAWFAADERKHMRPCGIQLAKAELQPHEQRLRGVNVRTIKKVAEAKARKKMKMVKRLEKVRKRAENVLDQEGVVDAEKAMQVKQLYRKSGVLNKRKRQVVYAVSKRSGAIARRPVPKGAITKRVDPRQKKDKRGAAAGKRGRGKGRR